MIAQPFRPCKVRLVHFPGAIKVAPRLDAQHDIGHFARVRAFGVRVQHAHIRDRMFVSWSYGVSKSSAGVVSATGD